jgi:AraC-like DNA-binding protein
VKLIVEKPSPLIASELVACEVVRAADFGCVWHQHPECEITLVQSGGTERWVGDKLTRLKPGDLVMLGSGLPHDYRNDRTGRGRTQNVEAVVVQFMPHLLGPDWLQRASMKPLERLFHRARLGLEVTGSTRRRVARLIQSLPKTRGLQRVILLMEVLQILANSKELVSIASPGFDASGRTNASDRIGTVLRHIEDHLAEPLYVTQLATLTGLSESAFSRLFRKATGRTVPQYLNELRIARACRLLADTDHTVNQIADSCGYPSPAHFQRQFQRLQKRAPLDYRRTVRAGA